MSTMELIDIELIQEEFVEEYDYELTPEEEKELDERIRESKAGIGIPHEIVVTEIREWLRTKK